VRAPEGEGAQRRCCDRGFQVRGTLLDGSGDTVDGRAIGNLAEYGRPVLLLEDPPRATPDADMLARTSAAISATMQAPGGWSLDPAGLSYQFPFAYAPAATAAEAGPEGYFRRLLESVAETILRKPPSTAGDE